MTKTTLIALAILGMVALVAQTTFGQEVIESRVGTDALVAIPGNTPTEVTQIDLPAGTWLISGAITFYESANQGTVFVGGNISLATVSLSTDGTTVFTSDQLENPKNIVLGVTMPPKLVIVGGDPRVFLVGYSVQPHQPPPVCYAFGFISAMRIRQNL